MLYLNERIDFLKTIEESLITNGYNFMKDFTPIVAYKIKEIDIQTKTKFMFFKHASINFILNNNETLFLNKPLENCLFSCNSLSTSTVTMEMQNNDKSDKTKKVEFSLSNSDFEKVKKYIKKYKKIKIENKPLTIQNTQNVVIE